MKLISKITLLCYCFLFLASCSKHRLDVRVNHNKLLSYGETNNVKLFCGTKLIAETTITKDSTYFSLGEIKDGAYDIALYGRSLDSIAIINDSLVTFMHPVSQAQTVEIHNNLNYDFDFRNCK